jgi:hypothetical protein
VRISENAVRLAERKLEASEKDSLKESMEMALGLFARGVEAFSASDPASSQRVIQDAGPLEAKCAEMDAMAQHHKGEVANALGAIIGSIRRIGEYTEDICENTINHLVAEGNPVQGAGSGAR